MSIALTREVSSSLETCELTFVARERIDVSTAARQHTRYVDALRTLGVDVITMSAEHHLADAVFVEDTALVLDELAIMLPMGAASRRAESTSVATALSPYRSLVRSDPFEAGAHLDGGDILRVGRRLYVGQTRRTNRAGLEGLRAIVGPLGYEVVAIEVTGALHLKTACTYIGEDTYLLNPRWLDVTPLAGARRIEVDSSEPWAANAVLVGAHVLIDANHRRTHDWLDSAGFAVTAIDLSELAKAEAGPTCLSLLFDAHVDGRLAPEPSPTAATGRTEAVDRRSL